MTFAEILKQEIDRRNWSAERAAREICNHGGDVSARSIYTWVHGGALPNMRHGQALVNALGIPAAKLLKAAAKQGGE